MQTGYAERSLAVFPAGCNGEFNLPGDLATVIERGEGCRLWTADGTPMLDFSMGWGSVLLGHSHPAVCDAVRNQVERGTNFAYVTEKSLELAEELVRVSPACDAVRFCASGTEATMYCLRLARAFTGRRKILKFEGAYHGSHDVGVTSLFPPVDAEYPRPIPSSAGVVEHDDSLILIAPYNDLEQTAEIVNRFVDDIAAVIVEPLQRCLSPLPGFLEGLRELTQNAGVQLIFDEVVTGFRLAYGGAQEYYGVTPDLVAYGKALGGGLPIGVYGGKQEIMEMVCEHRMGNEPYVWTASTLGGNPISCAAALATLKLLREEDTYNKLHATGDCLRYNMKQVLEDQQLDGFVLGDGPIAQIAFSVEEPRDYRTSQHRDKSLGRQLMLKLFERGIFLNPMGTKLYLSLAHEEATCLRFCEILSDVVAELRPTEELVV